MINDLRRMSSGAIHACLPRAASAIVADESRTSRDSLQTREIQEGKIELAVGTLSRFISGPINTETGVPDSVRIWSEIAVPFAGPEKTGLTTEDAGEAPWMMRPNHYGAHIMIDYSTVAWADIRKSNEKTR